MREPLPQPRLSELLDDDTLHRMMARDGVTMESLLALIGTVRRNLPRAARQEPAANALQ